MPKIIAKSAPKKLDLNEKMKKGCDGIELHITDKLFNSKSYENEFSEGIRLLKDYPIYSVHSPLSEMMDINIIELYTLEKYILMDKTFKLANLCGKMHKKIIPVVIHNNENLNNIFKMDKNGEELIDTIKSLLNKYPYTSLAIENVTPFNLLNDLFLSNGFLFENVEIAKWLTRELKTDRVGTVLDLCHAEISVNFLNVIKKDFEFYKDYTIEDYFKVNKDIVTLIHFNTMSGNGYGKGHGIGYNIDNPKDCEKLSIIMSYYNKYLKDTPLVLEVKEDDYHNCVNYENTKNAINKVLKKAC